MIEVGDSRRDSKRTTQYLVAHQDFMVDRVLSRMDQDQMHRVEMGLVDTVERRHSHSQAKDTTMRHHKTRGRWLLHLQAEMRLIQHMARSILRITQVRMQMVGVMMSTDKMVGMRTEPEEVTERPMVAELTATRAVVAHRQDLVGDSCLLVACSETCMDPAMRLIPDPVDMRMAQILMVDRHLIVFDHLLEVDADHRQAWIRGDLILRATRVDDQDHHVLQLMTIAGREVILEVRHLLECEIPDGLTMMVVRRVVRRAVVDHQADLTLAKGRRRDPTTPGGLQMGLVQVICHLGQTRRPVKDPTIVVMQCHRRRGSEEGLVISLCLYDLVYSRTGRLDMLIDHLPCGSMTTMPRRMQIRVRNQTTRNHPQ